MRIFSYLLVSAVISAGAAAAQAQGQNSGPMPCVEVQIGQDSTTHMDCVNEALKRAVEREHNTPLPQAPINAQSASNKVGVYNDAAARQMMGNSFGVSAVPQRPKTTFTTPLLPAAH
jgi:hypothetical protein